MVTGKPGEGLPKGEFLLIRLLLVPMVRTLFTWHIAYWLFRREAAIIIRLARTVTPENFQKMTVIDKTFAIEDHSRQYSPSMVFEHLSITGRGVMGVIASLSAERPFDRPITIEGVKPHANKADALQDFETFVDEYGRFFRNLSKKHSRTTKAHPWFGPFNNFDWNAFMYMHTFIHRRQLESILKTQKETL